MKTTPGFKILDNKGFHITFANGVCVSVQFGGGNYCQNYDAEIDSLRTEGMRSPDAELAMWDGDGNWITQEYDPSQSDSVIGQVVASDVLKALIWAEAYK